MDLSKLDWKFKLFGTPVRVMVTFWLICVFFSPFASNHDGPWIFGLLGWSAAVFLSFLIHEFGHAFAMRKCYNSQPRIDLGIGRTESGSIVFGGLTTSFSRNATPAKHAITACAGPLAEIAAAIAALVIFAALGMQFTLVKVFGLITLPVPAASSFQISSLPLQYFIFFFVYGFTWVGIVWGLFNLAPIYPSDGGQILLALLSKNFGIRGARMTLVVSIVCSLLLAALFIRERSVFMGVFFCYSAFQNYQILRRQGGF